MKHRGFNYLFITLVLTAAFLCSKIARADYFLPSSDVDFLYHMNNSSNDQNDGNMGINASTTLALHGGVTITTGKFFEGYNLSAETNDITFSFGDTLYQNLHGGIGGWFKMPGDTDGVFTIGPCYIGYAANDHIYSGAATWNAPGLSDGNFHFIWVNFDASQSSTVFVDGTNLGSSAAGDAPACQLNFSYNTNSENTHIGNLTAGDDGTGLPVDEFFVTNRHLGDSEVSAIWNGGTGQQITLIAPPPPPVPPTVALVWPQNGTSTPDFRNWYIGINANSGAATTTRFYAAVISYIQSSTVQNFHDFWPNSQQFQFGIGLNGNIQVNYLAKKNITFLNGENWCAQVFLYDQTVLPGPLVASSSVSCFTIDSAATIPISGITNATSVAEQAQAQNIIQNFLESFIPARNIIITPSSTAFGICENASDTPQVITAALFCPTGSSEDFMRAQFNGMTQVFPFSLFYGSVNTIQQVIASGTAEKSISVSNNLYGTINFLNSSTLVAFIGQAGKDEFFELQKDVAWLVIMFATIEMIVEHFHPKRKKMPA